jgi:transposase
MGNTKKPTPENYIKDIRRKTRRLFTAEQKVLIVMEALRAEISVPELRRKHQFNESHFYKWIGSPKRHGVPASG